MSLLADILGNASSGGIVGLIGGITGGVLNYFQSKADRAFKLEEMKLTATLNAAKTAGDIALAREAGAASAFTTSQKADLATVTSGWVSNLRGFTRPGLTWFFTLALFTIIAVSVYAPTWLLDAPPLLEFGVTMITDTTGMMIAWWFGSRQIEKQTRTWGNSAPSASVK